MYSKGLLTDGSSLLVYVCCCFCRRFCVVVSLTCLTSIFVQLVTICTARVITAVNSWTVCLLVVFGRLWLVFALASLTPVLV